MAADDAAAAGVQLRRDLLDGVHEACDLARLVFEHEPPLNPQTIAFALDVVETMVGHLVSLAPRERLQRARW